MPLEFLDGKHWIVQHGKKVVCLKDLYTHVIKKLDALVSKEDLEPQYLDAILISRIVVRDMITVFDHIDEQKVMELLAERS